MFGFSLATANDHLPPINVVATIKPLQLVIADIAGDLVSSTVLLQGAASPHHFSLRISDRVKIRDADVFVWVGPGLEQFLADIIAEKSQVITFSSLPGLTWPDNIDAETATAVGDPHLWLSLHNIRLFATAVTDTLIGITPDHRSALQGNLQLFNQQLQQLERSTHALFNDLRGGIFVYHDGFRHFTSAYKINQVAALTQVPEDQLSARQIQQLQLLRDQADCLLVDIGEHRAGKRFADVLKLPLVEVDILGARNPSTFFDYYTGIADKFVQCLKSDTPR